MGAFSGGSFLKNSGLTFKMLVLEETIKFLWTMEKNYPHVDNPGVRDTFAKEKTAKNVHIRQ